MIFEQALLDVDDGQLAKAAGSDPQAFDLLYRRHVTAVYRYCFVRTNSVNEAEELTSQVFLAAWEGLPTYRGKGAFAAWLFGIARRKCADFQRRRYRQTEADLDTAVSLPDGDNDAPEEFTFKRGVLDCVQQQLSQLSADRQEALRLRFWGGLSVKETAVVMRKSEGAVKMLVSRAVAELKERCLSHE